jgi:O-antigen ligase
VGVKVTAWISSAVALIGVLQWIQQASGMNFPLIPEVEGRIGSTMGNAAFLASYLGLAFFVTILHAKELRGNWRMALFTGAALQILTIVLSATRGTLLAFIVAGGIACLYVAWRGVGTIRTYARVATVAGLMFLGVFVMFREQLAQSSFEPIRRVAGISLQDATVESRLFIWREVGAKVTSQPLLGVGAENIEVLFNEIYDPTAIVEQWFDRTHNAFLDYLVQFGFAGLALYLLLIVVFIREAWRRTKEEGIGLTAGPLFTLLVVVYIVQNFFVFDTALTLWLFLILFAVLLVVKDGNKERALSLPKLPSFVPLVAGALITILIVPVSILPLRANWLLAEGYLYHVFDARKAVATMEKGYALDTYATLEYGYQTYEMYTERQLEMLKGEARIIAYRFVEKVLSENFEKYPYDARTATYYAHVLDSAPPEITRDDERLKEVIARAIELSPRRIQPWYLLANMFIRAGDVLPQGDKNRKTHYMNAVATLSEYSKLVPKMAEPRFVIATLYLTMGDLETAKTWADEALPLYKPDLATARRAARFYVTTEDWKNASRFLQEILSFSPKEYNIKYDLAKAEFLNGNIDHAKQLVEELKKEAPGMAERDPAFMEALNATL